MLRGDRRSRGSVRGAAAVALAALVACSAWAAAACAVQGADSFVWAGSRFALQGDAHDTIARTARPSSYTGYDGQFYLYTAVDPTAAPGHMDVPAYRYSHLLYPFAARALAAGQPSAAAYALVAVNVLAIAAGTFFVALLLGAAALPQWPAALWFLYPGTLLAFGHDLAEPLAYALVAAGVWAFVRRRPGWSAAAFALAALTRETALLVPVALAAGQVALEGRDRRSALRRAVPFVLACAAPYALLRLSLALTLSGGGGPDTTVRWWPFSGLATAYRQAGVDDQRVALATAAAVCLLLTACALALRCRRSSLVVALAVNLVALGLYLPAESYVDRIATQRLQLGTVVLALAALRPLASSRLGAALVGAAGLAAYAPLVQVLADLVRTGSTGL